MIFFTVSDSRHIQGAALVTGNAVYQNYDNKTNADNQKLCYCVKLERYRTTELPIDTTIKAAPDLFLPLRKTQYCQDMLPKTGESLMKAVWNSPLVTLYKSWTGEKVPPAPDALLTDLR